MKLTALTAKILCALAGALCSPLPSEAEEVCSMEFSPVPGETAFAAAGSPLRSAERHCSDDFLRIPFDQQSGVITLRQGEYQALGTWGSLRYFGVVSNTGYKTTSCLWCDPLKALVVDSTSPSSLCAVSVLSLKSCSRPDTVKFDIIHKPTRKTKFCTPSLVYSGRDSRGLYFTAADCSNQAGTTLHYDLNYGRSIRYLDQRIRIIKADNQGIYFTLQLVEKPKSEQDEPAWTSQKLQAASRLKQPEVLTSEQAAAVAAARNQTQPPPGVLTLAPPTSTGLPPPDTVLPTPASLQRATKAASAIKHSDDAAPPVRAAALQSSAASLAPAADAAALAPAAATPPATTAVLPSSMPTPAESTPAPAAATAATSTAASTSASDTLIIRADTASAAKAEQTPAPPVPPAAPAVTNSAAPMPPAPPAPLPETEASASSTLVLRTDSLPDAEPLEQSSPGTNSN